MNLGQGKKQSRSLKNVIFLIIGSVILFFALINFIRSFQQNHQINQEIANLNSQINSLQQENAEQKRMIEYFNSSAYIEDRARSSLGLKREGENVVVTNNPTADLPGEKNIQPTAATSKLSNLQKWWHYFFK
jgi:cell division protein FtsB